MSNHPQTPPLKAAAPALYRFEGLTFDSAKQSLTRDRDGHPSSLTRKESLLLCLLIERRGQLVAYDEMRARVWDGGKASLHTIHETKRTLLVKLGAAARHLEGVTGKGYRFDIRLDNDDNKARNADNNAPLAVESLSDARIDQATTDQVTDQATNEVSAIERFVDERTLSAASDEIEDDDVAAVGSRDFTADQIVADQPDAAVGIPRGGLFAGHGRHAVAACALYAALYVVALFVEIAYELEFYAGAASKIAPLVFVWMFLTSLGGLRLLASSYGSRGAKPNASNPLLAALLVFVASAVALHFALGFMLPARHVTQARFQTYTAHGAYLKSVLYFLPLAVVFLILPFHVVLRRKLSADFRSDEKSFAAAADTTPLQGESPRATLSWETLGLRPLHLAVLLLFLAVLSVLMTSHLFENLQPHPQMNLFMQLVLWRALFFFAFGLECVLWFTLHSAVPHQLTASNKTIGKNLATDLHK